MILCARPHNSVKYNAPCAEGQKGEFCYNAFALKQNILRVVSGRVA